MANSFRPIANCLPLEIISRIIFFVTVGDSENTLESDSGSEDFSDEEIQPNRRRCAALARISSQWRIQAQQVLYETILIDSMEALVKLISAFEFGMGNFTKDLTIYFSGYWDEDSEEEEEEEEEQVTFSGIPNLDDYGFGPANFRRFNRFNSNAPEFDPFLPNLTLLTIYAVSTDWCRETVEAIIKSAPNLIKLSFFGTPRVEEDDVLFGETESGPVWNTPTFKRLELLFTNHQDILEEKIWKIDTFEGLQSLDLLIEPWKRSNQYLRSASLGFFEVVGKSLRYLKIFGIKFPLPYYHLLLVLEILHIETIDEIGPIWPPIDYRMIVEFDHRDLDLIKYEPSTLVLPSTLTHLQIENLIGPPLSLSALKKLESFKLLIELNLTISPWDYHPV